MRFPFLFLAVALIGCASSTPTLQAQAAKIYVARAGLYRLGPQELQAAGWSASSLNSETLPHLHLVHRGHDVPYDVEGQGSNFTILFYADPVDSEYSPTDVYWLKLEDSVAPAMATRTVKPSTDVEPPQSLPISLKFEQDMLYSPKAIGGAHWFWKSLTAPASTNLTITLPALRPDKAELHVALAGETTGAHNVQVLVDDQPVGTAQWEGQSLHSYQAEVTRLGNGDNVVTLDLPGAGDAVDVVLVDSITIDYSSDFLATDDVLGFGGSQDYRVKGFRSGNISLYDITDPGRVEKLQGFAVSPEDGGSTLTFHDDLSGRRYVATTAAAFKKAAEIRLVQPNDLLDAGQQADYLAIAPAGFAQTLQPLLDYRSAHGLKARFVDVDQIYDAFSYGVQDPHAIRDFIQYALQRWAKPSPRFILLAGKASYDYRDNLKAPNRNLVPTFLLPTPDLGDAASDDWFVAAGDADPHPNLAIGRIPSKNSAELNRAIDKILQYSAQDPRADWRRRAVFVTDKQDPSFDASADRLAANLPKAIAASKVYLSAYQGNLDSTRAEIVRQWNSGALLMTYIGHGSIDTWAAGPLFSAGDAATVNNDTRLPVLLTPTCLDGFFYHPQKDSLAEDLLFSERGGIVAGLVPTGLSLPGSQDVLMNALFNELFVNRAPTLGEAIERAKQQLDASSPDTREVMQTFELLGDPALQWAAPK